MIRRLTPLLVTSLAALACADTSSETEAAPEADAAVREAPTMSAGPSVSIVSPASGDTVAAGSVEVTLSADGLAILPAGDTTANSGHHHLFLDADVSPAGQPIPAVPGSIVHMGDASSSYLFENVAPGEHRLIAVVGDWQHVPLEPMVVDTVMFVVR
jgi:hypothetical protein